VVMGTGYNPRIVTDGLVLCLDAANARSLSSNNSTSFVDLSPYKNNGSFTNTNYGAGYSSNNSGYFSFDGLSDYCSFYAPNLTTTATVEMYAKIGTSYSDDMFFGFYFYSVYCRQGNLGYNTANGDVYGISSTTVSNLGLVGNWKHYVFEMRSDVSYTNNKIYIETELQSLSQQNTSESSSNRSFNNGYGRISTWIYDLSFSMAMDLGFFRIYNRALTADEIRQNYLATKERYA
jgi:hypothetical protein